MASKKQRNVLVTGGAGYIGSHTCKALAEAGYRPIVYDNLVHGHQWAVKWGTFEEGDVADRNRLNEVFAKYKIEAVIHFAAHAYVGESVQDPAKYYRNNMVATLMLLEVMRDNAVKRMVFSSSCAVYGVPDKVPIVEEHPKNPISPYGASKLMVERMLEDFDVAHKLRFVSLRYFNAAGADPSGKIGECHNPETHLIPLVLDVAAGVRSNISVFGSDYETPDGTCIRDYIHVTDLADAHVLALEYLKGRRKSRAFNLGIGDGHSVLDVIETVESITSKVVPYAMADRRAGDPPVLVAQAKRAMRSLKWRPAHSDLRTIVRTAWNWHNKAGKLKDD